MIRHGEDGDQRVLGIEKTEKRRNTHAFIYKQILPLFRIFLNVLWYSGFPGGSEVKASACNVGALGSIPGSGRSPGGGNGNPLQYSCLENPMDGGAW